MATETDSPETPQPSAPALLTLRVRNSWNALSARFWASETAVMTTMAILVGIGGGLGTVAFRKAVDGAAELTRQLVAAFGAGNIPYLFMPAIGGLIVGIWMYRASGKGPGQGVAGIMEAVALHGGRIAPRGALARVLGAVVTIGSGGSAGPEDPSVQIGATWGSVISRFSHLSETRIRTLVGCGAAAGLAAAFNAPIAAVFFAIEIILGEFSSTAIGFVVLSSVAGAVVSQTLLGSQPAFQVPVYELTSPLELGLYGILGVGAALVSVLYINALGFIETLTEEQARIPSWAKPALGGLLVGILGVLFRPEIFGTGYSVIQSAFQHPSADWTIFFALVFLKLIATTVTLGSGGQGGLFAPSLFLGAMLGVGSGLIFRSLFPALSIAPAAYGLVGMAAVLVGAVRAPITAIVLPFEMTNDYRIIVPLMTAATLSYLIAQKLQPDSVYTQRHRKRGIDLRSRRDENLMRSILVDEAMTRPPHMAIIPASASLHDLTQRFQQTGHHGFIVLDENGDLFGVVSLSDMERAVNAGQVEGTVADICTRDVITAFPDESLEQALGRLSAQEFGRMPVVDRRNPRHVVGSLRRSDIVRAYSRALADQANRSRHHERLQLEGITGNQLLEIDIDPNDPVAGRQLKEIKLPADSVFVSIRRGTRILIPRGETTLLPHDRVLATATPTCVPDLLKVLKGDKNQ